MNENSPAPIFENASETPRAAVGPNNGYPWKRMLRHLPFILALLYFGAVIDGLLFSTAGVFERDGFFHARYAQMLPERGLSRQFYWMQYTDWKEHFCDKDFLYHVALLPFCAGATEPLDGAKFATLMLNLAMLCGFYALLLRLRVPWPLFWLCLLPVGSAMFLNRMLMLRSHVLSVPLMILACSVILRRRFWPCAIVGFIYAWSYSFPLAMLITALCAEAGCVLAQRRFERPRAVAGTLLGVAAGLLIHPYSPNTFAMLGALLKIAASGATGGKLALGSEFLGQDLMTLLTAVSAPFAAFLAALIGALALWAGKVEKRTLSLESASMGCVALGWFAGMFIFSRLVEYFVPVALLFAGLVLRDLIEGRAENAGSKKQNSAGFLCAASMSVLVLACCQWWSLKLIRATQFSTRGFYSSLEAWERGRYFDGAAKWMKQNIAAGATVVNFHWDDFPELFYSAPEYYYLVGLDPTLMQIPYPERAAMLEEMRTQKRPLDFKSLQKAFQSNYVIMRRYRAAQFPELQSGSIKPVFADKEAVIYRLDL